MIRNNTEKYRQAYSTIAFKPSVSKCFSQGNRTARGNPDTCPPKTARTDFQLSSTLPVSKFVVSKVESCTPSSRNRKLASGERGSFESRTTNFRREVDSIRNQAKGIAGEREYRTSQDQQMYSEATSIMAERQPRNSRQFIENLPSNTLFYCTHCFQYVFDIQKKRHYPQCKDAFSGKSRGSQEYVREAWRKLERMLELSKYTNTKREEIEELYVSVERGEVELIERVDYAKDYQFWTLGQIEQAFAFTYDRLLRGVPRGVGYSLLFC